MALNERQRRFCHEYVKCGVIATAAIKAGYSNRGHHWTAAKHGSRLLKKDEIREYIDGLLSKADNLKKLTPETIKMMLLERATDPEARDADRIRAAELLGKADGMFKDVHLTDSAADPQAILKALADVLPADSLAAVAEKLGVPMQSTERH